MCTGKQEFIRCINSGCVCESVCVCVRESVWLQGLFEVALCFEVILERRWAPGWARPKWAFMDQNTKFSWMRSILLESGTSSALWKWAFVLIISCNIFFLTLKTHSLWWMSTSWHSWSEWILNVRGWIEPHSMHSAWINFPPAAGWCRWRRWYWSRLNAY